MKTQDVTVKSQKKRERTYNMMLEPAVRARKMKLQNEQQAWNNLTVHAF